MSGDSEKMLDVEGAQHLLRISSTLLRRVLRIFNKYFDINTMIIYARNSIALVVVP